MKEVKIKFITFCDYASVGEDKKINILGIFDRVNVNQFPGGLARAFFVAMIITEPNLVASFSVKGKLGNQTVFPSIAMDGVVGETGHHNILLDVTGISFPEAGKYEFVLSQNGKEIGSTFLEVGNPINKYEKSTRLPN